MRIKINLKQNGTLLGRNKKVYEYEKEYELMNPAS
jgi:hypothetical protein